MAIDPASRRHSLAAKGISQGDGDGGCDGGSDRMKRIDEDSRRDGSVPAASSPHSLYDDGVRSRDRATAFAQRNHETRERGKEGKGSHHAVAPPCGRPETWATAAVGGTGGGVDHRTKDRARAPPHDGHFARGPRPRPLVRTTLATFARSLVPRGYALVSRDVREVAERIARSAAPLQGSPPSSSISDTGNGPLRPLPGTSAVHPPPVTVEPSPSLPSASDSGENPRARPVPDAHGTAGAARDGVASTRFPGDNLADDDRDKCNDDDDDCRKNGPAPTPDGIDKGDENDGDRDTPDSGHHSDAGDRQTVAAVGRSDTAGFTPTASSAARSRRHSDSDVERNRNASTGRRRHANPLEGSPIAGMSPRSSDDAAVGIILATRAHMTPVAFRRRPGPAKPALPDPARPRPPLPSHRRARSVADSDTDVDTDTASSPHWKSASGQRVWQPKGRRVSFASPVSAVAGESPPQRGLGNGHAPSADLGSPTRLERPDRAHHGEPVPVPFVGRREDDDCYAERRPGAVPPRTHWRRGDEVDVACPPLGIPSESLRWGGRGGLNSARTDGPDTTWQAAVVARRRSAMAVVGDGRDEEEEEREGVVDLTDRVVMRNRLGYTFPLVFDGRAFVVVGLIRGRAVPLAVSTVHRTLTVSCHDAERLDLVCRPEHVRGPIEGKKSIVLCVNVRLCGHSHEAHDGTLVDRSATRRRRRAPPPDTPGDGRGGDGPLGPSHRAAAAAAVLLRRLTLFLSTDPGTGAGAGQASASSRLGLLGGLGPHGLMTHLRLGTRLFALHLRRDCGARLCFGSAAVPPSGARSQSLWLGSVGPKGFLALRIEHIRCGDAHVAASPHGRGLPPSFVSSSPPLPPPPPLLGAAGAHCGIVNVAMAGLGLLPEAFSLVVREITRLTSLFAVPGASEPFSRVLAELPRFPTIDLYFAAGEALFRCGDGDGDDDNDDDDDGKEDKGEGGEGKKTGQHGRTPGGNAPVRVVRLRVLPADYLVFDSDADAKRAGQSVCPASRALPRVPKKAVDHLCSRAGSAGSRHEAPIDVGADGDADCDAEDDATDDDDDLDEHEKRDGGTSPNDDYDDGGGDGTHCGRSDARMGRSATLRLGQRRWWRARRRALLQRPTEGEHAVHLGLVCLDPGQPWTVLGNCVFRRRRTAFAPERGCALVW